MWSWIAGFLAIMAVIGGIFFTGYKAADGPWERKYSVLDRSYTEFREMVKLGHSDARGQYNTMDEGFRLQAKLSKEYYDEKSIQDKRDIAKYRADKLRDSETIRRQFGAIDALAEMRARSLCGTGDAKDPELSRRFDRLRNGILDRIIAESKRFKRYAQKCNARLRHIESTRIKSLADKRNQSEGNGP